MEVVDAFYWSLPSKYRVKYRGTFYDKELLLPQEKLRAIYRAFDKVNPEYFSKVGKKIVENEIEDRIIGALGRGVRQRSIELQPHGGLPVGFQFGSAL